MDVLRFKLFVSGLLLTFGISGFAGQDLETLDQIVGRWMDVRTTLASEKSQWKNQKQQWEQEIALLKEELEILNREWEAGQGATSTFEQEQAGLLAKRKRLLAQFNDLNVIVATSENQLRKWEQRIPAGLTHLLASGFEALPVSGARADRATLTRRTQTVIALWSGIEDLQNNLHSVSETLTLSDGTRRLVDVMYLGLAQGFAVATDDSWAAVGTPGPEGWTWADAPEHAETFRTAIDLHQQKKAAHLLNLPLQLSKEAAQ